MNASSEEMIQTTVCRRLTGTPRSSARFALSALPRRPTPIELLRMKIARARSTSGTMTKTPTSWPLNAT